MRLGWPAFDGRLAENFEAYITRMHAQREIQQLTIERTELQESITQLQALRALFNWTGEGGADSALAVDQSHADCELEMSMRDLSLVGLRRTLSRLSDRGSST